MLKKDRLVGAIVYYDGESRRRVAFIYKTVPRLCVRYSSFYCPETRKDSRVSFALFQRFLSRSEKPPPKNDRSCPVLARR